MGIRLEPVCIGHIYVVHTLKMLIAFSAASSQQEIIIVPTERSKQRTRANWMFDPGAEADSIPLHETDFNTITPSSQNAATSGRVNNANYFAIFANPAAGSSTVIENSSPEHPADGEEATQTTAHRVCHNA